MEEKMKKKSLRSTVSLSIAVSWFVLSTACAFAIIDIGPSPGGSGAGTNNPGQKPSIEYDFGRPVFCGGCSANQIGAGLGDIYLCINKDCPITAGTADTDVMVSITYPQ